MKKLNKKANGETILPKPSFSFGKRGVSETSFPRPFFPSGKKGASILMIVAEIIVVIAVIWMTTEAASGMGRSETTIKINLANDIKMMVDTLVGVPGEVVIEYPGNVSKYTILLSQSEISVFIKGESDVKRVNRAFYLPEGYIAVGSLEKKDRLCLEKKSQNIFLRECKPEEK